MVAKNKFRVQYTKLLLMVAKFFSVYSTRNFLEVWEEIQHLTTWESFLLDNWKLTTDVDNLFIRPEDAYFFTQKTCVTNQNISRWYKHSFQKAILSCEKKLKF